MTTTDPTPGNEPPRRHDLGVTITAPPVTTTTEVLAVKCGDSVAYVARRNISDNTWHVSRCADGRDPITPTAPHLTYDQAVDWATRRVQHLATQTLAARAAARAAANQWPDPLKEATYRDQYL